MKRLDATWSLAIATFVLHLLGEPHYGFFRDELYFIVCGRHPAWGYVDQPPLVPLLAAASQYFGHSLVALRTISSFFAAASVFVACRIASAQGGGAFAQVIAGIAVMLGTASVALSTDAPGMWLWPLAILFVLRILKEERPALWLAVGASVGLCLETKYSVVFFAVALIAGLLATPERRILRTPWFFGGIALAVVLAAPSGIWQASHGYPMIELLRNGAAGKNVVLSPLEFVVRQLWLNNPVLSLVWIAGLVYAFRISTLRWLGWTYVALMVLMISLHAKDYYPAAVYIALFGMGGILIESITVGRVGARAAIVAAAVVTGIVLLPASMPILSESQYVAYAQALHLQPPAEENKHIGLLPQEYADMHGWPELAAAVTRVYYALPPVERQYAAVYTGNYGEAAAIDFFGQTSVLPPAISGHNQYFLWGPHGHDGSVVITVGGNPAVLKKYFRSVTLASVFHNPHGMPYEDELPIFICRHSYRPFSELWPLVKHYD
jgi:Dolichyl-phosphate-mannose-protein mannosyltransferase